MEEQLISFETAKLAKEKGFEIKCNHYYFDDGKLIQHRTSIDDKEYYAPTQSLLQKWLRYEHGLDIWMCKTGKRGERYQVEDITNKDLFCVWSSQNSFPTYENALEEGLQHALKLIKM